MVKLMSSKKMRTIEFIILDAIMIGFISWLGVFFIVKDNIFRDPLWPLILSVIIVFKILFYYVFQLYNLVLDFVGISEGVRAFFAVILSNVALFFIFLMIIPGQFPVYFFIFITPVEFLTIYFVRISKRVLIKMGLIHRSSNLKNNKFVNTIVIGAGGGGKLVLDEIDKNPNLNNKVIAFVDDDLEKINKLLGGIIVVGPISNTLSFVKKYNVEEVIIAIADLKPARLREIIQLFEGESIKIKRLPLMTELSGDAERHIVDVNIEDLLSRGVVDLNNQGLSDFIKGKDVLVTGGGGSIGSELCTQILGYRPKTLIVFDIYENTTYDVQLHLRERIELERLDTHLVVLIGSVYNDARLESVFKQYRPQLVFHAAAYKHVPLMEDNAVEAVRTNVLGTYNVARMSHDYHVQKMVLVSSDKAVRPTNIMGATKSCCEKIIQYFATISDTNYSAVRFGNVLGSNGSVVPLFKRQIAKGGPVTITDKRMTRYFMTITEAVSLILQSGVYATGGEIFILDMGEPVKIYDLAENMIRLSGLIPNVDIKIVEVGLRPGEKLFEELLVEKDKHIKTKNDKIFIEQNGHTCDVISFINTLKEQFELLSNQDIKIMVQSMVETYIIDNHTNN